MRLIQQRLLLCLICLCFSACLYVEGEPELQALQILDGNTEKARFRVEVASTDVARRRGLMYRRALPPDQGMLLDYRRAGHMAIWMKNTYIPLDLIFIDENGRIVKIHEGAEPLSTKRIESETEVRAVLEINAGQVKAFGIRLGERIGHASFAGS